MKLSEHIRALRKERRLTQEQLSDALGVSTAAISKWESGLSTPELPMLIDVAEFFEVSLDSLVGYHVRSHRREDMAQELRRLREEKRYEEAQSAAEDALRRYPNEFLIVLRCAELCSARGMEQGNAADLRLALELLDRAQSLFDQNIDPALRPENILHMKGVCCACLGWHEQAVKWFERSNVMGVSDQHIASSMVEMRQYDKALTLLAGQMYKGVTVHICSVLDAAVCLMATGRAEDAEGLISWGLDVIRGLEVTRGSYVLRMRALLCAAAAMAAARQGKAEAAHDFLNRALRWARRYDEQPDPSAGSVRFCWGGSRESSFSDNAGETAMLGVERFLNRMRDGHRMEEAEALLRALKG